MLSALHKMHLLTGSMRHLRPSSASFPASKVLFHIVLDVRWSVLFAVACLAAAGGDSEGFDGGGGAHKFAKFHPPLADAGGNFDALRRQLAMQGHATPSNCRDMHSADQRLREWWFSSRNL